MLSKGIFWPGDYVGISLHFCLKIPEEQQVLPMQAQGISADYSGTCWQLLWSGELRDEKEQG